MTETAFYQSMLAFFPEARAQADQMRAEYGMTLETVVLEDVVFPCLLKLLAQENDIPRIRRVFSLFEDVASSGDRDQRNLLSVTMLEKIGSDRRVLYAASPYMGPRTRLMQAEADKALGRPTD